MKEQNMEALKNKVEEILAKEKAAAKKKEKIYAGVAIFIFLWMSFLYVSSTRIFSAAHLMDRLQVHGMKKIADANQFLKDLAPKLASQISTQIAAAPSMLQARLTPGLAPRIDAYTSQLKVTLESHINELATHAIEQDTYLTRRERYQHVLSALREQALAAVDQSYRDQNAKLQEIKNQLVYLKNTPNLTEEERLQKQVLGSWLALLDHRGADWTLGKK